MFPGIDPKQLAAAKEAGQHIKAKITVNYTTNTAVIALASDVPQSAAIIPDMLNQFANGLAMQLQAFFAVQGELVEIGKK